MTMTMYPRSASPQPNDARVWAVWGGGREHYQRDLKAAYAPRLEAMPRIVRVHSAIRDAALTDLVQGGIHQVIDLGGGLPLPGGNAGQVAAKTDRAVRVAYVDHDVVCCQRTDVAGRPKAPGEMRVIHRDFRDPAMWPDVADVVSVRKPVAAVFAASLDRYSDDEVADVIAQYAAKLAAGSALLVTYLRREHAPLADTLSAELGAYHYTRADAVAERWAQAAGLTVTWPKPPPRIGPSAYRLLIAEK